MKRKPPTLTARYSSFFAAAFSAIVALSPASAQDPPGADFAYEYLGLEEGLNQRTIYAIHQTSDGFMWFGNQSGLNRYDGHDMKAFRVDPNDPHAMPERALVDIQEDSNGDLWMLFNASLARYDRSLDRFTVLWEDESDSTALAVSNGRSERRRWMELLVDSQDRIWVIKSWDGSGIQLVDFDSGTVSRFGTGPWNGGELGTPRAIVEADDGQLYVAASSGVYAFDPSASQFSQLSPDSVSAMVLDPQDPEILWTVGADLKRIDLTSGSIESYVTSGAGNHSQTLAWDPSIPDRLWLDVDSQLAFFDSQSRIVHAVRGPSFEEFDIAKGAVVHLYADPTGILWVGTDLGVFHFDTSEQRFRSWTAGDGPNGVLEGGPQVWFVVAGDEKAIWAGTDDGITALFTNRIDRQTGEVQAWKMNYGWPRGVAVDSAGRVWVIAGGDFRGQSFEYHGLYVYDDLVGDLVQVLSPDAGTIPSEIFSVYPDEEGSVWISTGEGLVRYNHDTGERQVWDNSNPAISNHRFSKLVEDSQGMIWARAGKTLVRINPETGVASSMMEKGTEQGIFDLQNIETVQEPISDPFARIWFRMTMVSGLTQIGMYDIHEGSFTVYHHDPKDPTSWAGIVTQAIRPDPVDSNIVYVMTQGFGLAELDVSRGTFHYYGEEDGLTNPHVYGAVWDNFGNLWFGTNSGVHQFDTASKTFRRFDGKSGVPDLEAVNYSYDKSDDGLIYIGTVDGLVEIDPSSIIFNGSEPFISLTDFKLFNTSLRPGEDSPLETSISQTTEITLAHNQNDISISFAAMHYKRPSENRLQYKLEGIQTEWIDAGERREASYPNLAPGTYTFQVIGANSDGVWNDDGASLRIIVRPPWWRTIPAYFVYGLMLIGLIFAVDRGQRARIVRREREAARERELEQAKEIEVAYDKLKVSQAQLVEQEKLASLGSLTAGIAHEIKNPLNFVNNFAEVGAEMADEVVEAINAGRLEEARAILAELRDNASQITKHGKRADSIVKGMMQHARGGASDMETVLVNDFLEEYANLAWHGRRAKDDQFKAELVRDFSGDAGSLKAMPQELGRVVLNLLNNAFDAVAQTDSARITMTSQRKEDGVTISVADNGPGIPDDIRQKIFEPFFTTKATGEGTGLGLSLSYDIITKGHGGTMTVGTSKEGGALFTLSLPTS